MSHIATTSLCSQLRNEKQALAAELTWQGQAPDERKRDVESERATQCRNEITSIYI